ncbi:glucosamine 6-phosphate synthetase-like amidotransferase/phosphosugar isomerase protein [Devosia subaequoris]|uniref:Glucosamine 6-phosphate synthetase-like amidotransferase/phosphosugar isomerase protein n=1 Tax=Devosia subaequoris TaxID=395930 RepID=A0A7W6IRH8_9HYPH|nr:glucosamine 6-phosphate synthetase-like amidotransferase/phosphosugar isomerase protein [Devosia subaequoris]MCP1211436.1 SIS domain-containing protein [Devosia subaequoris]
MDNEKTVMLREIALQPDFVRDNIDEMLTYMRSVVADRDPGSLQHGFMIGCGDSYCAAIAVRQFMMKATGRLVEAVEALEFSRYLVEDLPANSFVFGVSNSGTVSRTIEGVRLARAKGAWTFAVTVSAENKLAQAAETLIRVNATPNIKELPNGTRVVTPGTVTYTASMLGLYVAAIAIGERIGHLDAAASKVLVEELHATAEAMRAADASTAALAREIAASFTPDRHTVFVGGGPNYATAYFAMAKWFESLTRPAHLSQLEEWAHEHYFMTRSNVDTFIILPPGPGRIRGLEQARAAREMESRVIIIAEEADAEARAAADIFFAMPTGIREVLTPFVYKLVFEYLSCEISKVQNVAFLGFNDRRRQEVNFRQIFHSAEMA